MCLKYWKSVLKLGHSRTVVGIEEKKNKTLCLLLFDPGCPSQEMQKLLKQSTDGTGLKLLRRFVGGLKEKQYQIVAVDGILTLEEKTVSISGNSFCKKMYKNLHLLFQTQMCACGLMVIFFTYSVSSFFFCTTFCIFSINWVIIRISRTVLHVNGCYLDITDSL